MFPLSVSRICYLTHTNTVVCDNILPGPPYRDLLETVAIAYSADVILTIRKTRGTPPLGHFEALR